MKKWHSSMRLVTTDGARGPINSMLALSGEYKAIAPKAIECLLSDKDNLFRYLLFPVNHRKTIRNTNLIERVIREVRRRTKVMDNVRDNAYSVYAVMTGIVQEQNERWNKKSHWSSK